MMISLIVGAVFFFRRSLFWLCANKDPYIIDQGAKIMRLVAFLSVSKPPVHSGRCLKGARYEGDGGHFLLTVLAVRPGLSFVFINFLHFGVIGAWFALGVDQILRSVLIMARYNSGKWKHIKV